MTTKKKVVKEKEVVMGENQNVVVPQDAKDYEAMMKAYKEQNPAKYEMKKEAFEKRLAELSK